MTIKGIKRTEAQERVYLWSLISRARKVNMTIPDKWLKYGDIPKDTHEILKAHMAAFVDSTADLFEQDFAFYKFLNRR